MKEEAAPSNKYATLFHEQCFGKLEEFNRLTADYRSEALEDSVALYLEMLKS